MSGETKFFIGTILATILVVFGGLLIFNFQSSPKQETVANLEALVKENSQQTNPEAQVRIVEFGDFQCPACAVAHPTVKQVLEEYGDRVNFVFRHFPLPQHRNAIAAAIASEAAGLQGKFWEMHDKLFENQDDWAGSSKPLDVFRRYATELGLDLKRFERDFKEGNFKEKIENDRQDGQVLGVNSTPTFFVNNTKFTGIPNFTNLKNQIEAALYSQ